MPSMDGITRDMATVRNFHMPLPDPLYRQLRDAAARAHQPATAIARSAIDHWLRQQQRPMVQEAIAVYAADVAGTRDDLDAQLEAASLAAWLDERSGKKRRTRKRSGAATSSGRS